MLKSVTVGVLVVATAGCASAPPAPLQSPTVNVTGDWVGTWTCDFAAHGNGVVVMKLTQSGSRVTGPLHVTSSTFNRVATTGDGVVSGDKVLTESKDLSGTFAVSGDRMTGPFKTEICQGKIDMAREPFTGPVTTSRLRTAAMTVEALNLANRVITLRGPGGSLTMQVDERVKNLPQVSVGDTVSVVYYESWALALDGPGESASPTVIGSTGTAQMPAGFAARRTNIRATVAAIDAGKPSVTFRGAQGGLQEVSVAEDPRVLARLKVGETYDVSYTENLAVVVERPTKR
jgi:hypothetical protein